MLHEAMNEHPEIGKPPRGVHFFSDNFDRGEDWYRRQLIDYARRSVTLEFSVSYTYPEHSSQVAERISQLVPNAKLFAIVRNPVDRAFSDYLRSVRLCEIDSQISFEEALDRYPLLLERGCYYRLMSPYLSLFPRDRILIQFLDDLTTDSDGFWNSLWEYIGVNRGFRPVTQGDRFGRRSVRWPLMNRAIFTAKSACDTVADKTGLSSLWDGLKQRGNATYRRVIHWNTTAIEMRRNTRNQLADYYKSDVQSLEELTGRNLEHWRSV